MIIYRKGDVIAAFKDNAVDVIIHQTNCQGVMGSGIAKQIKQTFPEAYAAYKQLEKENGGRLFLGEVSGEMISQNQFPMRERHGLILNVNGQDQYVDRLKCNTNYAALGKGLLECYSWIEKDDIIAMPKIGAGLGGGDWKIIEAIIESAFGDRDVYVYELE